MEIIISKIWFGNKWNKMRAYTMGNRLNIIKGISGSGKTPMMALLGYSLGNSYMREFYFDQRNNGAPGKWGNEIFSINYSINHNSIKLNIKITLNIDVSIRKIYMTSKINNEIICIKSDSSKEFKNALIDKLGIPPKVFWSNTVIKRNFSEFHSFFFIIPNINAKLGHLYDVAQTFKAKKNSFISAYIFLMRNKEGIEILKKISKLNMVEKIVEKKVMMNKLISSFHVENQEIGSKGKTFKAHNSFILKRIEKLEVKKIEVKSKISSLNNQVKNINSNNRIINALKKYNLSSADKINIKSISDFLFQIDSEKNFILPTVIGWLNNLKKQKKILETEINSLTKDLENTIIFEKEGVEGFILEKAKKTIHKINEKFEELKHESDISLSEEDEELFANLISSWTSIYYKEFKGMETLIKSKFPNTFEFKDNITIKKGTGGKWLINYLKCFIALNELINDNDNHLPLIIDGIFDAGYDAGEKGGSNENETKGEIISEIIKRNKNQVIIAMTNEDWEIVQNDFLNKDFDIFKSPDGYEVFESYLIDKELKEHYLLDNFKYE